MQVVNINDVLRNNVELNNDDLCLPVNKLKRCIKKKEKIIETIPIVTYKTKTHTVITKELNHEVVTYKGQQYVVSCIPFNDEYKMFIFDEDDKDKVIDKTWHYMPEGRYIGKTHYTEDNIKKELYLHNFLKDKLTFEGKGQQHTIDHIDRIGTDNRKANLRMATSQSAQNFNQKKRERHMVLPPDCGITPDQVPSNIWYGKADGLHGDFFCLEIKGIPTLGDGKYIKKSPKSKKLSLKSKLIFIVNHLNELLKEHPELGNVIVTEESENQRKQLIEEYNDILKLSHYPKHVIDANLQTFTSEYIKLDLNENNNNDVKQKEENEESVTEQLAIMKEKISNRNKYPIGIRIAVFRNKNHFILDHRNKTDGINYNLKMIINESKTEKENYEEFKKDILKKYPNFEFKMRA